MSVRRNPITRLAVSLAGMAALLGSVPASAEINGIVNGRSADPATMPPRSIEIGLHERDFTRELGVRFNFAVGPTITGFANAAFVDETFGADGYSFGGGAFIFLPNQRIVDFADIALKPTLNYRTLEGRFRDYDTFTASFELLASGKEPLGNTPLGWYANAGLAVALNDGTGRDGTDFEPQIGVGAYLPLGNGQLFFGLDIFGGNPDLGVGYRFFL